MSTTYYGGYFTEEESSIFRERLKNTKQVDDWLLRRAEESQQKYLELEQFLMDLDDLPWYKTILIPYKIRAFLKTRLKYNF